MKNIILGVVAVLVLAVLIFLFAVREEKVEVIPTVIEAPTTSVDMPAPTVVVPTTE